MYINKDSVQEGCKKLAMILINGSTKYLIELALNWK